LKAKLIGVGMAMKRDDWVKTEFDEVVRVVHVNGSTVFVAVPTFPKTERIEAYPESRLTKVTGPPRQ
jgi:hypothetical protein